MTQASAGLEGYSALMAILDRAGPNAVAALASALYVEGLTILAQADRQVPLKYGALEASGRVTPPRISGAIVEVDIGFGGSGVAYAVVQHERTDFVHTNGRKAHYLSDPMEAAAPDLHIRLADRIGRSIFTRT